jgi:3-dehydroquinate dehydratase/shikimate dehydrogenase
MITDRIEDGFDLSVKIYVEMERPLIMKSIVVSVWGKTADEMIAGIKQAEEFADVIEVRFDSLEESEFDKTIEQISILDCEKPFLATFRPKNEHSRITPSKIIYESEEAKELHLKFSGERWQGWFKILNLTNIKYVDLERDIQGCLFWDCVLMEFAENQDEKNEILQEKRLVGKLGGRELIFSEHFFEGEQIDLEKIYRDLAVEEEHKKGTEEFGKFYTALLKIAAQTDDISDGLTLWNLLKIAEVENRKLIPIAMGEAGKWTRILGLAYGAPMTYASLETGKEAAPGQISAKDLRDVYRVKELTEATEIYGVIGDPVKYSLSPYMQNGAFKTAGVDAVFIPFEVKDLSRFVTEFIPESGINLSGFSITIPHKQAIIPFLDEIDETAQVIGAVNTVKIVDGKLRGFNTDAHGFITPLKKALNDLTGKKAAILGAGGAARACIYALQKEGVEVTVFARDVEKAQPLKEQFSIKIEQLRTTNDELRTMDIVINATPLGTKGENEDKTIAVAEQLKGVTLAYDLVYNPNVTRFMREASEAGVPHVLSGLDMLAEQGAQQFKIWTGQTAPLDEMKRILSEKFSA